MPLNLIYITNDPAVALIAEQHGVGRIMVDLETLGKEERQKNMNTVKSHHSMADVRALSAVLKRAELMVRIDPWHSASPTQIEAALSSGAKRLMLPMWKHVDEARAFLAAVHGRAGTTLLLETKEAAAVLDEVLALPFLDELHIGLNDLHLSYGQTFMFEPLADGTVERLCAACRARGIPYGFGGIARIGEGTLPAERIVAEHYRLGSSYTILSRSFCHAEAIGAPQEIAAVFSTHMARLRAFEATLENWSMEDLAANTAAVQAAVAGIVQKIKEENA